MSCNHDKENCTLDMGRGCSFCGGGTEAEATVCEGCFKLHETDWLADYPAGAPTDIFEVRFKNTRKSYYKNIHNLPLKKGDVVAVEASPGHDIGIVSLTGDMVARQMKRTGFTPFNGEFKAIYRKAKPYDLEKWQEAIALEHETMIRSRQIAKELRLDMKIGDVEYQGDRIKAIFYYIADGRVDFRELIKVFASEFGIKVEMKQIGARQEAGRIGGLGSCGRELCCASWIAGFNSITTGAARTQDISLNPQKLAGQCCKLKCCLVYELDAYIDARKSMPRVNEPLRAEDGDYYLISSDILRRTMSFNTQQGASAGNVTLPVAKVREIIDMNRKGKKPESLLGMEVYKPKEEEPSFVDAAGEESITRFDSSRKKSKNRGNRNRGEGNRSGEGGNGQSNRNGDENRGSNGKQGFGNGRSRQNRNSEGGNGQPQRNRQNEGNHRGEGNKQGEGANHNHNRGRNNRNRPPKPKPE
jgi:cell fate regulator YaaT (PSP1 superfamily)